MTDDVAPRRTELLTTALRGAPSIDRAQLMRIDLAPGQAPGAHSHPCDVVGYVISGTIRFQIANREATELHAGDAFFEPRDTHIAHFDNASDQHSAAFLACYLLGQGVAHVIEMITAT
jgi:quercetin dioxygenase-like cupin family protein